LFVLGETGLGKGVVNVRVVVGGGKVVLLGESWVAVRLSVVVRILREPVALPFETVVSRFAIVLPSVRHRRTPVGIF